MAVRFGDEIYQTGGESKLPRPAQGSQFAPKTTALQDGNYLITWVDEATSGLRAQLYHRNGHVIGPVRDIHAGFGVTMTADYDIASDADGRV